jgi:hypothetical protein
MRSTRILTIALAAMISVPSFAAQTHRSGNVDSMQMDSHSIVARADVVWLRLTGTWPGTTCLQDWVWFNGKENPQFVALALTARTMGLPLDLWVDDTYAKDSGFCQVTNMTM